MAVCIVSLTKKGMPNNKVWLQAYFLWPYVENPHCLAVWLVKNKLWVSFVAKVSRCGKPLEIDLNPGWLFGTFFIFHNIWDNPFHWLIFFKMVKTTNQIYSTLQLWMFHPKSWVFFPGNDWINVDDVIGCYRHQLGFIFLDIWATEVELTNKHGGLKQQDDGARTNPVHLMIWWLPLGNYWFIDGFLHINSNCYFHVSQAFGMTISWWSQLADIWGPETTKPTSAHSVLANWWSLGWLWTTVTCSHPRHFIFVEASNVPLDGPHLQNLWDCNVVGQILWEALAKNM